MAKDDTPAVALTFEQLKELLGAASLSPQQMADIAAEAAAKQKKPENATHPGKSVYSHPEGERERPKDKLKCDMFIGSCPIEWSTITPAEVAALNAMTPGHYSVETADGGKKTLEVRGQRDANQRLERMWILINPEDPDKGNYGGLARLANQFTDVNRIDVAVPA